MRNKNTNCIFSKMRTQTLKYFEKDAKKTTEFTEETTVGSRKKDQWCQVSEMSHKNILFLKARDMPGGEKDYNPCI